MGTKMNKADCEQPIKSLTIEWRGVLSGQEYEHPSFYAFRDWLRTNGYGGYLKFRSRMGAEYDAELWFDQALGQTWRR
jgi:hypothetical protein